ncbi:MAG: HAMP domain-containing histidine kinase [Bacteroidales bacterium]|nr:HAMP domain-containing histidine kinase [Bacteroidales bacterium]
MSLSPGVYIITVIVAISLLFLIWNHLRQRKLIRKLQELARSLEESKQQIIQEQERNRQLKQEMTNNIAHELKTPVSSIRGYLEILLGDKPVEEQKKQFFLQRCYSQTMRLSELINDVSLINKLEESADLFPRKEISIPDIADEAISDLEDICRVHNITVRNSLPRPLTIVGNHSLAYCIFRNLLENAVFYAGDGVEVGIECYKTDEEKYYLRFYDTGSGVDNAYLPKLFDRFLRIEEGRSRKTGGTGLGLSIVKHSVLFHGGDIYVRNREEGGLEFFFSLKKRDSK